MTPQELSEGLGMHAARAAEASDSGSGGETPSWEEEEEEEEESGGSSSCSTFLTATPLLSASSLRSRKSNIHRPANTHCQSRSDTLSIVSAHKCGSLPVTVTVPARASECVDGSECVGLE